MRHNRILLTSIAVALATVTAASAPAHAARRMVVLIDASGSMTTPRNNADGRGANRFEAAKSLASDRVNEQFAVDAGVLVAVYTFHDTATLIPATHAHGVAGFIDFNSALDEIAALTTAVDIGGSTPLAGAMCLAIDQLTPFVGDTQILQISSDGEENSTPVGAPCHGDLYTGPAPYPPTSWEAAVLNHLTGTVIVQVDLFDASQIDFAARLAGAPDPEGILAPEARALAHTAASTSGLTPLEQFFTILAQTTGGQLNVVHDDEVLPVFGDLNNDRCVDHTDAILVARAFGPVVPPVDGRFDLNRDRTVDFADYQIQLSRMTSTCGPDPYKPRDPLVCKGAQRVVIDGQSIEDGGLTIDARGSCEITIRNSLIVSGKNAIHIVGSAVIRVDNSIIVGQDAVLMSRGATVLSAGNTVFHGKTDTQGAFQYIDRGGNVFE